MKRETKGGNLINLTTTKQLKMTIYILKEKVKRPATDQEMIIVLHIFESFYTTNKRKQDKKQKDYVPGYINNSNKSVRNEKQLMEWDKT